MGGPGSHFVVHFVLNFVVRKKGFHHRATEAQRKACHRELREPREQDPDPDILSTSNLRQKYGAKTFFQPRMHTRPRHFVLHFVVHFVEIVGRELR